MAATTTTDTKTSSAISMRNQTSTSSSLPTRSENLTSIPERKVLIRYVCNMKRSNADHVQTTRLEDIFYPINTQIDLTGDTEYKYEYHEYLDGKVVPYYDFEFEHTDVDSTFDAGDMTWNDFITCQDAVKDVWGTDRTRFIWQSACGWKVKGKHWKSSFHCLVRGAGYVNSVSDIPMTALAKKGPDGKHLGQDPQPYNGRNRQLMRAFASTKEDGSRPLKYFVPNMEALTFDEIDQAEYGSEGRERGYPPIAEQFIQYIDSENHESYIPAILRELEAEFEEPDSKEIKREREPLNTKYRKIGREELREHIANLAPERVGRGTVTNSRHRIVWAIANYAAQLGEDLHEEARMFRKLDMIDWKNGGELSCDKCYDEAIGFRKHMSGIGTILACSREDNEEGFKAIIAKYRLEGIETMPSHEIRCFRDYTKFSENPVNNTTIIEWIRSCIYPCVTGKGVVYLILHNDYDSDNEDLFNATHKVCELKGLKEMCKRVPIECKNPNKAKAEKKPVCYNLWDVVEYLLGHEKIIPTFSRFDFVPYNKPIKMHREIFNTFIPFEMTRYVPRTEKKFEGSPWQQHIKTEICNDDIVDPGLYMWLIRQIATLIQYPGKPGQLFIALFSVAQGTGKSMIGRWITSMLGLAYCKTYPRAADFFSHFNAIQEGKIFVFLEETGEQDEMDKNANHFKALIDSTHIDITYKGLDTFRARNILHLWASTNKRNFMHMPGEERRTVIIEVNERLAGNRPHFKPIDDDLKDPDYIKACFDYFSSVDLTGFDSCEPFVTQIKRSRKNECKNVIVRFVEAIFNETDLKEYHKLTTDVFDDYKLWARTVENIPDREVPRAMGFARNMSANHLNAGQTGGRGDRKSYYTITRDAARNLIRAAIKNPDFKFLSDD